MKLNKWMVNAATAQAYKDGRADAIEEFEKAIRVETLMPAYCYILIRGIKKKLLREKNEDGRTEHNPG